MWPGDKGVERYFGHAVEWSLDATELQVAEWIQKEKQDARQQQAASQPQSHSLLGWILGSNKVYAAAVATPPKLTPPAPPPIPVRDCQRVMVALSGDAGAKPGDSDQLAVLQREPAGCRAD